MCGGDVTGTGELPVQTPEACRLGAGEAFGGSDSSPVPRRELLPETQGLQKGRPTW